ncbi:uncharacterized protein [Aquarana catesbeiana]|uniref:uncharacterized protein isoform X2 n=1 Tax=Aquarana catesbeiana TaxID=8400 RepID=UPI003CCA2231
MNYILAFLIFSGVIATGHALKCVTCKVIQPGRTLNDCDGEIEECDKNTYKCATQIEQNSVDGDIITTVKKGCFPVDYKDYCGHRFELNAGKGFYLSVFSKCCDKTDGCNKDPIQREMAMDYAIQGCLTEYACMLNFGGLPGSQVLSKHYTCTLLPSP